MSLKLNPMWERYKGGGGSAGSGKIEYPPYLTNMQSLGLYGYDLSGTATTVYGTSPKKGSIYGMIGERVGINFESGEVKAITDLQEGTPYSLIVDKIQPDTKLTIPDPDDYFGVSSTVQTKLTALDTAISALSDSTELDNAQDTFEQDTENTYLRAINRFAGQMSEINAVNSSAFILGMALMENSRQRHIADFRSKLAMQDRYTALQAKAERAKLEIDFQKMKLVAATDKISQHVEMAVQSEMYGLELWEYGQNMLAAISGGVTGKGKSGNKLQSALAGSLMGGGLGLAYAGLATEGGLSAAFASGAAFWPLGIGLGIGALFGLLMD